VRESYEFRVEDEVFHARVEGGRVESGHGSAWEPALTITSDRDTFRELAAGELSLEKAARTHKISVEGDRRALRRFERIFRRPEPKTLEPERPAKATNAA
jgi:alkyl sulfatase BDS1-like metallo-beta-lactamase superfamily hydrolase